MKIVPSLLALLWMATIATAAESPKNIVLILADDLGWADTTLYGKTSLYETPNIQRLAARGMTFSHAYASPICSPTRASIMTGQNPARHGMTAPAAHLEAERFEAVAGETGPPHQKSTNVKSATRLDPELPMLGQVLKNAGYSTAHFGKWHLGREPYSPLERGFDVDLPHWHGPGPKTSYVAPWGYENPNFKEGEPGDHIEDRMAKEAVTWLKNRDRSKPFYMNYWQFSVHAPFGAKPELIERYRQKIGNPKRKRGTEHTNSDLAKSIANAAGCQSDTTGQQSPTYAAMVHSLDDAVGSLIDALDAEGITDETVIIFYSDNGGNVHCGLEEAAASGEKYITSITSNHPLRGGKGGIHEGGVRVPAVIVWPGLTKPGARSDVRIQSNDLYPTILRILNIDHPKDHVIDGVDFVKALRGEQMDRGPMFTHVPGHGNTPQWLPPSMSVHDGDWKLIRTFHYGENGKHQYLLYNLREDIGENNNLAAAQPAKVKELDQLIENYIVEANVVIPLPNSKFDPAKFDPKTIGVQAGGLKMPPGFDGNPMRKRGTASSSTVQGWTIKNADATIDGDSLIATPAGRQPFIANAKVRAGGPVDVRLRIRTKKAGEARLQWRTEGQELFPTSGQAKSFDVAAGDWQELTVQLPVEGKLVHLRLFLSNSKRPTEIDWIEIGSQGKDGERWDFSRPDPSKPNQRAKRRSSGTNTKQLATKPGKPDTSSRPKAKPGQVLFYFSETFDDFDPAPFLTKIPNANTQVRDGVLWTRGESGGKYPPMVYLGVDGKDLQVSFRYRHLQSGGMVWFFIDGDDGFGSVDHMLRVRLNRTGVQLQIDSHSLNPNHPERQNTGRPADKISGAYRLNKRFPQEDVDLSNNEWRQVKLVFHGDTVKISVDGETWNTSLKHACFIATKRKLLWMQKGGEKGIEIDNIKVTEATTK